MELDINRLNIGVVATCIRQQFRDMMSGAVGAATTDVSRFAVRSAVEVFDDDANGFRQAILAATGQYLYQNGGSHD